MPDDTPEIDLVAAMEAMHRSGAAIARSARELRGAGVQRDRMLCVFAGQVALAVLETSEAVWTEEEAYAVGDHLTAMLAIRVKGMPPMSRA